MCLSVKSRPVSFSDLNLAMIIIVSLFQMVSYCHNDMFEQSLFSSHLH